MSEDKIMDAIDEMMEDMRDMASERDVLQSLRYFEEWLEDLVYLGEQAANLLREISDPDSIPTIKDVIE